MKNIKEKVKSSFAIVKAEFNSFIGLLKSVKNFIAPPRGIVDVINGTRIKSFLPVVFYGYWAYYFARRYADKRTKAWKPQWDQRGGENGIFVYSEESIIVLNKIELKRLKKQFSPVSPIGRMNVKKYFKRSSYYKTKTK